MSLRVLFVTPGLESGGAERQWATLIPRLRAGGIDARVLCLGGRGAIANELEQRSVPIEIGHTRGAHQVTACWRSTLLQQFRPDVIISRPVSAQFVAHWVSRRRGVPHVLSEHRGPGLRCRDGEPRSPG